MMKDQSEKRYQKRLKIALKALEDYEKSGSSIDCRGYAVIVKRLRMIPFGTIKINKIREFKDFIPKKERAGHTDMFLTEMALLSFISYLGDQEKQEYINIKRKNKYKNNPRFREQCKQVTEKYLNKQKNREKHNQLVREYRERMRLNPDYIAKIRASRLARYTRYKQDPKIWNKILKRNRIFRMKRKASSGEI